MIKRLCLPLCFMLLACMTLLTAEAHDPTVSTNRICDLDKAAGSGITITNPNSEEQDTFVIFYTDSSAFVTVSNETIAPDAPLVYQPLPSTLASNYTGWALVSESFGTFSVTAAAPGVMHAADFETTIVEGTNLVFLDPVVTGENCYNNMLIDWGDGSAVESQPKGTDAIFHGYPGSSGTYTITMTTRLRSNEIISHTEQIEIEITPLSVTVQAQETAGSSQLPILAWGLVLLLLITQSGVAMKRARRLA